MARVVVAEDDPDVHELIGLVLESAGHDVRMTSSGEEALGACREHRPEVVLLDVTMPGELDGYTVARRLREDPLTIDVPIVMLTARTHDDDVERGRAAGADDYVLKPFDADALLDRVAELAAQGRPA